MITYLNKVGSVGELFYLVHYFVTYGSKNSKIYKIDFICKICIGSKDNRGAISV